MMDRGPLQHIVVLAPNWLGDAAMATPALRALHRRFPEARLTVAGRSAVCGLLDGLPWIDRLIQIPAQPGLADMIRFARALRPKPDLCVVLPHSIRSGWLAWWSGAPRRLGQDRDGRRWLLTETVAPYREHGRIVPIYMGREYLDLVASLGCEDDGAGLELVAPPEDFEEVRRLRGPGGPVVGLAPGAAFGPSKLWPAERFAALADTLAERKGARCVLITGPGEENTRDAVLGAAKRPLLELQAHPPTLGRLKAIIASLDLLVGNDSGPRHIAVAFKKPVICLMGPTSPRYSEGPWEHGEVLRVDVDCGPCQKPICTEDHRCMTRIPVERAVEAAMRWLD